LELSLGIWNKFAFARQSPFFGGSIALVKSLSGSFSSHGQSLLGRFGNVLGSKAALLLLLLGPGRKEGM
jgi:hypothetical protein